MTLYLVDASVVAEFLIGGTYTANAQAFFRGAFTVPELCLSECANVIWKQVQHRGMPAAQALQALRDLKALPLRRAPTKAVLGMALGIGLKHNLAIYDSLYIALALRSKQAFVTLDGKQGAVAIAEGVTVKPITDFKP